MNFVEERTASNRHGMLRGCPGVYKSVIYLRDLGRAASGYWCRPLR